MHKLEPSSNIYEKKFSTTNMVVLDDAKDNTFTDGIPIPSAPLISHLSSVNNEDFSASAPPLPLLDSQPPYNPSASVDINSSLSMSDSSFPKIQLQEEQPFLQSNGPVILSSKPRKSRALFITFCCIFCCCTVCCCLGIASIGTTIATICAGSFHSQYTITPNGDYSSLKKLKFNVDGQVYFYVSSVSTIEVKVNKRSRNEAETRATELFSLNADNSVADFKATNLPTGTCGFSEYTIMLPNNLLWLKKLELEISTTYGGIQKFGPLSIFPFVIDSLQITSESGYIGISEVQTLNFTKISTTSGSINLNLITTDVLQCISESGYFRASHLIVSGATASLQVSSTSGAIQIGQFDATSQPHSIQIQTTTGYAKLEIPSNFTGQYSLQSNTGSLRVLGNSMRQKSVSGVIGTQNSSQIIMKSISGSLQLDQTTK